MDTGKLFCRMSFGWDLSDVFLMIRLELWVWGRKTTEAKHHSHHILSRAPTIKCPCWPWQPGRGFDSSTVSYSPPDPLSIPSSLEGRPHVQSALGKKGSHSIFFKVGNLQNAMKFSTEEICLFSLIYVSIVYSIIFISVRTQYLFCTLGYNPIILYFVTHMVPALVLGCFCSWLPCPLDVLPIVGFGRSCCFEYFLTFWNYNLL